MSSVSVVLSWDPGRVNDVCVQKLREALPIILAEECMRHAVEEEESCARLLPDHISIKDQEWPSVREPEALQIKVESEDRSLWSERLSASAEQLARIISARIGLRRYYKEEGSGKLVVRLYAEGEAAFAEAA